MKPLHLTLAAGAVIVVAAAAFGAFSPAVAQQSEQAKTPSTWSYEIRNGRRVPRGNRVTAADGSWREEVRDGACRTVRTMSATGEYREVRECN